MDETEPDDLDRLPARSTTPAKRTRPALLTVEALVVAGALVLAVVLVGKPMHVSLIFPWQSGSHPAPVSYPRPTAARATAMPLRFDPTTRRFLADGLRGTVPAAWFVRQQEFLDIGAPGVGGCFGDACDANLVDHPIQGNIPWGAEFEVAQVEDLLTGSNLDQTADKILSYWKQFTVFYTDVSGPVIVTNESERTLGLHDTPGSSAAGGFPRPARMITAELHYHKPGVPTRYDHFYLLVVQGSFGQYTAFVAAWSDNATDDATNAIQESINSLQVV